MMAQRFKILIISVIVLIHSNTLFPKVTWNTAADKTATRLCSGKGEGLSPYFQPVKTAASPSTMICFGPVKAAMRHERLWQSEVSYRLHNDLAINHPIFTYKISLSAQTADG
jgi:hypothetical protein